LQHGAAFFVIGITKSEYVGIDEAQGQIAGLIPYHFLLIKNANLIMGSKRSVNVADHWGVDDNVKA
jgi:hypothetical protein